MYTDGGKYAAREYSLKVQACHGADENSKRSTLAKTILDLALVCSEEDCSLRQLSLPLR